MNLLNAYALLESLEHDKDSQVVLLMQTFNDVHLIGEFIIIECFK